MVIALIADIALIAIILLTGRFIGFITGKPGNFPLILLVKYAKMTLKQTLYLLTLLLTMTLTSCVPDLNFEEPQPAGYKDKNKFNNKYQGTYLCIGDSSILTIDKDKIIQEWHIVAKLTKAQIDTTEGIELKDGILYSDDSVEPLSVKFIGDTAVLTYDFDKTIFQLSDDQVLRNFKGLYFLNYKESNNFWTVKTLTLDKEGILTFNRIYGGEEEIRKIKEMTTVEEITDKEGKVVNYKVRPTKKELKKILKSNLFEEGTRFQKIKK